MWSKCAISDNVDNLNRIIHATMKRYIAVNAMVTGFVLFVILLPRQIQVCLTGAYGVQGFSLGRSWHGIRRD
jgi:hypothetical protein